MIPNQRTGRLGVQVVFGKRGDNPTPVAFADRLAKWISGHSDLQVGRTDAMGVRLDFKYTGMLIVYQKNGVYINAGFDCLKVNA